MISKETENVQSSQEIENAFRAITAADRPYVTKEELYAVSVFISSFIFLSSLLMNIYNQRYLCVLSEPYKGDGRLLCGKNETVRRSQDRKTNHGCIGLHRIYAHAFPKLVFLKILTFYKAF